MAVISIDIGGSNFRVGAINESGVVNKFEKLPTKTVFLSGDILADLAVHLKQFMEGIQVEAIAIGFPATLNSDRSKVVQAPNISFMEDLPVVEVLERELKVPVVIERDVTFALCYDMAKYSLPKEGLTCGIYFGTGIGNAMLLDGKPWGGCNGVAGELGHIPVIGSEIACGCGNVGCLEAVAGGKALARIQKEHFPQTSIGDLFLYHGEEEELKEFVDAMAVAVAAEVNIMDPHRVFIGGGIMNMKGFPRKYMMNRITARVRKPLPGRKLELIFTEDEADKSVVGGAIYVRQRELL